MPLHPVPIIVGGALALVGSGYAFKKYIYEPHLAPLIEAWLEAHHLRAPVSLPAAYSKPNRAPAQQERQNKASSAQTSTYELSTQASSGLRRRRSSQDPLLRRSSNGRGLWDGESVEAEEAEAWGRESAYDLRDSLLGEPRSPLDGVPPFRRSSLNQSAGRANRSDSLGLQPLINLENEGRRLSHDEEVREVIFQQPPTPLSQSAVAQASSIDRPRSHEAPAPLNPVEPSTTFSFLSLSQVSSPEAPTRLLEPMMSSFAISSRSDTSDDESHSPRLRHAEFGSAPERILNGGQAPANHVDREDDVLSLPETSSSYVDAETYSTFSSPRAVQGQIQLRTAASPDALRAPEDLGLTFVSPPRESLSVMSLSEDEEGFRSSGHESASDWDEVSEAGGARS